MNLEIRLVSKPYTTVQEAAAYVVDHLPHSADEPLLMACNPEKGTVLLHSSQMQLTDVQRDWLHMSDFAARYIDSYHVEDPEHWTLQAAGDLAESHYEQMEYADKDEALWFLAIVNARAGEQIERATNALERIAAVLEAWRKS